MQQTLQPGSLNRRACAGGRLRKDPLDPIDTGTKVALGVQRIFNPRKAQEEAAKRRKAEEEAAAAAKATKKAGSWGGLP